MNDPLQVSNLEFRYERTNRNVLDDIGFILEKGLVLTLLGPNGCGKSTLLSCIDCILKPQKGVILVNNTNIFEMDRSLVARTIGLLPQEHKPSFAYKVIDLVLMGRAPRIDLFSMPTKADEELAYNCLKNLGIEWLADKSYTNLSGGEMQLVLIARALAQEPEILLFDEPTSHLDFRNQIRVLKIIRSLAKERGMTIVMTLHDPNHAMLFSDKVIMMKKGSIVSLGRPTDVITKTNMEMVYEVPVTLVQNVHGPPIVLPETRGLELGVENHVR